MLSQSDGKSLSSILHLSNQGFKAFCKHNTSVQILPARTSETMSALVWQAGISRRLALSLYIHSPTLLPPQIHCYHDVAASGPTADPAIYENLDILLWNFYETAHKVRHDNSGTNGE